MGTGDARAVAFDAEDRLTHACAKISVAGGGGPAKCNLRQVGVVGHASIEEAVEQYKPGNAYRILRAALHLGLIVQSHRCLSGLLPFFDRSDGVGVGRGGCELP